MYYKTFGNKIILKKHVVPHLYLHRRTTPPPATSQITDSAKKRKETRLELFEQSARKVKRTLFTSGPDELSRSAPEVAAASMTTATSPDIGSSITVSSPSGKFLSHPYSGSALPSVTNVVDCGIQVNIRKKYRSVATMTSQKKYVSRASSPISMETGEPAKQKVVGAERHVAWTPSDSVESVEESMFTTYTPSTAESSNTKYSNITSNRLKTTLALVETKSRFYLGLPEEVHCFVKQAAKFASVSTRDILITIKKIRQDDVYERLGDDFDMSSSNVQKIFTSTVPKLADVAQELIFWPDHYSMRKTLPIPFRYRYRQVESIIDCFEIEIEKSSDVLVQALTWSEYKKCNTLKYMVSATPRGMVNFVSEAFGGRTSDRDIFEKSKFLDSLPENAKVMADRGFKHVAALLTNRGSELIRPPSVHEGEKLSKEQVKENKRIASLRVHIERVIRRLREFTMLNPHSCIHHSLWYLMNHIVIIACGLVNIQGTLIQK